MDTYACVREVCLLHDRAKSHSGLVAQWITRLPTEQKIPGSSPGKVDNIFPTHHVQFIKQSDRGKILLKSPYSKKRYVTYEKHTTRLLLSGT